MEQTGRSLKQYEVEAKFSIAVFIRTRGEWQIRKPINESIK
jgi:hypothetical protein